MSDKIISRIKKIQSDIKGGKTLPFPVLEIQKEVQNLNTFVKSLLKNENQMLLPNAVQAHVVRGLVEINQMFMELKTACRSNQHFELYRGQFLLTIQLIQDLSFCIHISIENGFYEIEPRGSELYQSLELSWAKVQGIYRVFFDEKSTEYFPPYLLQNQQLKKCILDLYEALAPQAASVLKFKRKDFRIHRFSLEELKIINRYFRLIYDFHRFIEQQRLNQKVIKAAIVSAKKVTLSSLLQELSQLEQKVLRNSSQSESVVLREGFCFSDATTHDLNARLNSVYIRLEVTRILTERYHMMQGLGVDDFGVVGVEQAQSKIESEQRQLRFFIMNMTRLNQSLQAVRAILTNLSISFGKIFQLSMKSDLSLNFLVRAFQTVHNLLSKSISFAQTRKEDSQALQAALVKTTLFHKPVEDLVLSALKDLEDATMKIANYDREVLQKLKEVSSSSDQSPSVIQSALHSVYEERSELSAAAVCLNNIDKNFNLLVRELLKIEGTFLQLDFTPEPGESRIQSIDPMLDILKERSQCPQLLLDDLWETVQDLNWFMEDVQIARLKENSRFEEELEALVAPVQQRIKAKHLKQTAEANKKTSSFPALKKKQTTKTRSPQDEGTNGKTTAPSTELAPPEKKVRKPSGNIYDPFQAKTMEILKKTCQSIARERTLSVLEVLERPHAFFNFLDHLEEEFEPDHPGAEAHWLSELQESQSALDFFLGFAKVKFLPYGYFNANGEKAPYDKANQRFDKNQASDLYLKISSRSLETPKGIFIRLMRIILRYDDVITLNAVDNQEIINVLKMDHLITDEEKDILHQALSFVS